MVCISEEGRDALKPNLIRVHEALGPPSSLPPLEEEPSSPSGPSDRAVARLRLHSPLWMQVCSSERFETWRVSRDGKTQSKIQARNRIAQWKAKLRVLFCCWWDLSSSPLLSQVFLDLAAALVTLFCLRSFVLGVSSSRVQVTELR